MHFIVISLTCIRALIKTRLGTCMAACTLQCGLCCSELPPPPTAVSQHPWLVPSLHHGPHSTVPKQSSPRRGILSPLCSLLSTLNLCGSLISANHLPSLSSILLTCTQVVHSFLHFLQICERPSAQRLGQLFTSHKLPFGEGKDWFPVRTVQEDRYV